MNDRRLTRRKGASRRKHAGSVQGCDKDGMMCINKMRGRYAVLVLRMVLCSPRPRSMRGSVGAIGKGTYNKSWAVPGSMGTGASS
jgi:hypothetical protein